uniref:Sodium/calcium exchanger membrane region domain-containing protein n=1 Tax=Tetradesmus obliquus TaxID=3088 RepID=A0A383V9Q3_TETOB|eukprot:jgi/Sobl393_1/18827/SZX61670.1
MADLQWGAWGSPRPTRASASGRLSNSASGSGEALNKSGLWQQVKTEIVEVLLKDKMNVLLLLLPFAVISKAVGWAAGATFLLSLLPLCSLAERLGMITEQLAMYTNDTLGGLLNATFGNATEVIIAAFAIKKGLLRVVKLTLLGSIISNLLLVMGSAFVAGGLLHPTQSFNQQGVVVNSGLLVLAVVAIMLPTLLSSTAEAVQDFSAELALSRFESVLMLLCYGLFLVFQLVTHRHLYEEDSSSKPNTPLPVPPGTSCCDDPDSPLKAAAMRQLTSTANGSSSSSSTLGGVHKQQQQQQQGQGQTEVELVATANGQPQGQRTAAAAGSVRPSSASRGSSGSSGAGRSSSGTGYAAVCKEEAGHVQIAVGEADTARLMTGEPSVQIIEEEEEELVLSKTGCFVWLAVVTLLISILSDFIMDAISDASRQLKVPMPFLTTIVVPIVGNAAEHASALIFAVKNRMEISLGVAIGSSTQIGVLVIPFCVILAWCVGQPLDLNFNEFEALVLFISVLLAALMVQDGSSNWLKGSMLILTYLFVAAGFWVHKDPLLASAEGERH